ncbi:MAG: hypothetical protein Q9P90_00430 [candidate division KSB1 bacterium]|nr:hypothetical protein [candidate division KSB1 bacterium]
MSVNGTDNRKQIESLLDELNSQYETLEKLYSLLQIINYNLDKKILNFLQPLNMAKATLLEELHAHKKRLDTWIQQGIQGQDIDHQRIEREVQKIKSLAEQIEQMEEENLAKMRLISSQDFLKHQKRGALYAY